jgi:septal ring factor EnvC (AmiA/AmiB activator)
MLLRICLIVAILGAGAVVAVNFVMVKPVIETTINQREEQTKAKTEALGKLATAQKSLTTTSNSLVTTTKTLAATKTELNTAKSSAEALETQNAELTNQLAKVKAQSDNLGAQLAKWDQMHITPLEVTALQDNLKKTALARDGVSAENKLLVAKLDDTQKVLDRLRGTNITEIPQLPAGLKGQVVAVDPKYGFVILNIGEDKGVLANGIMIIARDGNLIGKVQIARVDKTQSVANILPAWRHADVMEGDEVIN